MIDHREWLATRRRLLESVKTEVRLRLGEPRRELGAYARAIERDYRRKWRASSLGAMAAACRKARVILAADFHAYAQAQKAHARFLRDHLAGVPVVLALECLRAEDDEIVARFLAGVLSEERFLNLVRWEETWGFPWPHYRPFFVLARERGYRVVGLNRRSEGSLAARDRWTARRLKTLARGNALVFAVIGEWHVASAHLPKALGLGFGEVVTILQDVEKLYLARSRRGRTQDVEVLRAPGGKFCHFVSPPWMKWQSYLLFLERAYDRDLSEDAEVDYSDHVAALVRLLETDLGVDVSRARLQVFCPNSRASLARLRLSVSRAHRGLLKYCLARDLSFFIPERDWLYLSRPTINHAAALAGQYVHAQLARRTRALWSFPEDFPAMIWVEAIGFFFSKWINPRRKADTLESVTLSLAARHPRDGGRRVLALVLDQRLSDVVWTEDARVRPRAPRRRRAEDYVEASRVLGSMLGERLFQTVRAGKISLPRLMSYLKMNVENAEFGPFYRRMMREVARPPRDDRNL